MNLTTEDYEKINNLIQTNEDENKAIAAGIIANMDEEQFFDWLQSVIDLYYPVYIADHLQDRLELRITFFEMLSIKVFLCRKKANFLRNFGDRNQIEVDIILGENIVIDIDKEGNTVNPWCDVNDIQRILQAFKDLFE